MKNLEIMYHSIMSKIILVGIIDSIRHLNVEYDNLWMAALVATSLGFISTEFCLALSIRDKNDD